jgi:3-ketoacyl-CoA synthase
MARRAKYSLQHHVRVHIGSEDAAFGCMGRADDGDGTPGVFFNSDVPACAMKAVTAALTRIAPRVLTLRQLAAAARHELARRKDPSLPPYAPAFAECVDHFALHPGIHAMLKGFMNGLKIPPPKMMPSFAALRDYANTSASSTWYVLSYIEAVDGLRKGDTVMQLGVGAGVKCGINVWKALRTFKTAHPSWAHLKGVPVTEADLPLPLHGRLTRPVEAGDEESSTITAAVAAAAADGGVMQESVEMALATQGKLEGLLQGPSRTARALAGELVAEE